jgi:hypothetical protein
MQRFSAADKKSNLKIYPENQTETLSESPSWDSLAIGPYQQRESPWVALWKHAAKWIMMCQNLPKNGNYFACHEEKLCEKLNSLPVEKT